MIHNSQDTISQVLSRKPKHVFMQQCVMIMLVYSTAKREALSYILTLLTQSHSGPMVMTVIKALLYHRGQR